MYRLPLIYRSLSCGIFILILASFSTSAMAGFSSPLPINSTAASDSGREGSPAIAAGGNNTWISVWVGPSANPVDPRAD